MWFVVGFVDGIFKFVVYVFLVLVFDMLMLWLLCYEGEYDVLFVEFVLYYLDFVLVG